MTEPPLSKLRTKQYHVSVAILKTWLRDRQISAGTAAARSGHTGETIVRTFRTTTPTSDDATVILALAETFGCAIPLKPSYAKFHNRQTVVDEITFDSKAEAAYYEKLKIAEHAGQVRNIVCHPLYVFAAVDARLAPRREHLTKAEKAMGYVEIASFRPDFAFEELEPNGWRARVVDVKINATNDAAFKLRCRMLAVWFGLDVEIENTDRNAKKKPYFRRASK